MTPEQLKSTCNMFRNELKTQGASMGIMSVFDSMCSYLGGESRDLNRALAALEESQQQIKELKEGNRSACESRDMAYRSRDEAIVTSNQHYKQAFFLNEGLIEAQQTIARQQERERSIIYEVSEIHKEAAAGNNGSLDRADTAFNRIMLLSSNVLALGNKEEAVVPVTPNCPTCGNQHPIDHPSRPGIYLCVPCDYVYEEGSDKS